MALVNFTTKSNVPDRYKIFRNWICIINRIFFVGGVQYSYCILGNRLGGYDIRALQHTTSEHFSISLPRS